LLGGTLFIGIWIVRQFVDAGHTVRVLHRRRVADPALVAWAAYEVVKAPLRQMGAIEAALGGGAPECVIHVVAIREAGAVAEVSALAGGGRGGWWCCPLGVAGAATSLLDVGCGCCVRCGRSARFCPGSTIFRRIWFWTPSRSAPNWIFDVVDFPEGIKRTLSLEQ
jgi:hypothetical protein